MTPREQAALSPGASATILRFGPFRFDRANGILVRGDEEQQPPRRVLALLAFLLDRAGQVVTKQALLDAVWSSAYVTETSLSEAMSLLRQVLGDDPQRPTYIQTVHRRGYRFIAPLVSEEGSPELFGSRQAAAVAMERIEAALAPELGSAPAGMARARVPPGESSPPSNVDLARHRERLLLGLASFALGAGAVLLAGLVGSAPVTHAPPIRFAVAAPTDRTLLTDSATLTVSPDGRHIVFGAERGEQVLLFERDLERLDSHPIAGTSGASSPFFSPDGRSLAFFSGTQLLRVPLTGGPAVPIAAIEPEGHGGSWSPDGTIVFASGEPASLYQVPAAGGAPRRLTGPDAGRGETGYWWPQVLPDGNSLLFTVSSMTTIYDARIEWLSLVTGQRRTLVQGGASGRYASGTLIWAIANRGTVTAPMDAQHGRLTGPTTPLLDGVFTHPLSGMQLAVGGDTLAYLPDGPQLGQRRLVAFDGPAERALPFPLRYFRNVAIGPERRVAVTILDRDRSDVWLASTRDGALTRLTFEGFNIEPVWSPDGMWVSYASNRKGPFNVYRGRADGSLPSERLLTSPHHQYPTAWSPDGREVLVSDSDPETGYDIAVLELASRRLRPLLRTKAQEIYGAWSPDGRWIAYSTDETGRWEVVVRSYPELSGRWQLSSDGGLQSFWSANGRTLYYHRGNDVWAVPVAPAGHELRPGSAHRVLSRTGLARAAAGENGGLIGIVDEPPHSEPAELRVLSGWHLSSGR